MRKAKQFKPPPEKWIGVDFDATLVTHYPKDEPKAVGAPIHRMVERVRHLLDNGVKVKIFTARVWHPYLEDASFEHDMDPANGSQEARARQQRYAEAMYAKRTIELWCDEHFGRKLPVTCVKDPLMSELWDDRAVHVAENLGILPGNGSRYMVALMEESDAAY